MENCGKSIAILASWNLVQVGDMIYIPSTHYLYLDYIVKIYKNVFLVSQLSVGDSPGKRHRLDFSTVSVVPLPYANSYLDSIKNVRAYYKALSNVCPNVDIVYSRVPDPFSWMPTLLFKTNSIRHFVGDTIDATKHNEKWSWFKKQVMLAGYLPEYALTLLAALNSHVYTNGHHISDKLLRYGIKATPVVSSTVRKSDLNYEFVQLPHVQGKVVITYIGYVRFAKGMNCLMDFCKELFKANIDYKFNLIGNGEMIEDVKKFVELEGLKEFVILHGHIDDKSRMNSILRESDLFFFPSLSEGSPRVVIEAMAQGIPVLSTPVGSLPDTFEDEKSIRFFNFNDSNSALRVVKEFLCNTKKFDNQRRIAFSKVESEITIDKFLSRVFKYDA